MIRSEKKRWLVSLFAITAIIIVSITIIIVSWEKPYSISSALLSWFHVTSVLIVVVLYCWYLLVVSSILPRLLKLSPSAIKYKKYSYSIFITILSLIIGEAYSNLIWNVEIARLSTGEAEIETVAAAAVGTYFQIFLIVVPLTMFGLAVYYLSYSYLKLNRKHSAIAGAVFALLSPFWLVVTYTV